MTDAKPYSYVTLRYVHDIVTGEFINVGVIVCSPQQQYLNAKLRRTHGRLSKVFPDFDRSAFKTTIDGLRKALRKEERAVKKTGLLADAENANTFALKALPRDDSSFQWSPMGGGLTTDANETLDRLYDRLISRYDERSDLHRGDDEVWRPVRDKLIERSVPVELDKKIIRGEDDEIEFKHAWKNGVWHCYEALSFDLANADSIRDKARRWSGHLFSVSDTSEQFKPFFLVGAPSNSSLQEAAEAAIKIIEKSYTHPAVYTEDQIDEFVDRIEDDIRSSAQTI